MIDIVHIHGNKLIRTLSVEDSMRYMGSPPCEQLRGLCWIATGELGWEQVTPNKAPVHSEIKFIHIGFIDVELWAKIIKPDFTQPSCEHALRQY